MNTKNRISDLLRLNNISNNVPNIIFKGQEYLRKAGECGQYVCEVNTALNGVSNFVSPNPLNWFKGTIQLTAAAAGAAKTYLDGKQPVRQQSATDLIKEAQADLQSAQESTEKQLQNIQEMENALSDIDFIKNNLYVRFESIEKLAFAALPNNTQAAQELVNQANLELAKIAAQNQNLLSPEELQNLKSYQEILDSLSDADKAALNSNDAFVAFQKTAHQKAQESQQKLSKAESELKEAQTIIQKITASLQLEEKDASEENSLANKIASLEAQIQVALDPTNYKADESDESKVQQLLDIIQNYQSEMSKIQGQFKATTQELNQAFTSINNGITLIQEAQKAKIESDEAYEAALDLNAKSLIAQKNLAQAQANSLAAYNKVVEAQKRSIETQKQAIEAQNNLIQAQNADLEIKNKALEAIKQEAIDAKDKEIAALQEQLNKANELNQAMATENAQIKDLLKNIQTKLDAALNAVQSLFSFSSILACVLVIAASSMFLSMPVACLLGLGTAYISRNYQINFINLLLALLSFIAKLAAKGFSFTKEASTKFFSTVSQITKNAPLPKLNLTPSLVRA